MTLAVEAGPGANLGCGYSTFDCPRLFGSAKASTQYFFAYARNARQVCKRVLLSFPLKADVSNAVVCLLLLGRPPAIFWRVASGVIDSVYGVVGARALSHVGKEETKFSPSLADSNPALLIMREGWIG